MARLILAAALLAGTTAGATTLVITHPEDGFDEKSSAAPATVELLKSTAFKNKYVLMVYPEKERNRYTFDPQTPGVSFTRKVSSGGQLEEDLGDTNFVVGGGFLSACMQDTVTDLIRFSNAKTVRIVLAATYFHASPKFWPGIQSTAPHNLADYETAASKSSEPNIVRELVVDIGARIQHSLDRHGAKRQVVVYWRGKPLAVPRGPAPENRVVLNFD